jgi:predicted Zn-dependent protease
MQSVALGGAIVVFLLGMVFSRSLLSAGFANYGALAQTQTEMKYYNPNFYDEPSLDQIRRQQNLSNAENALNRALGYDPANRTALQRLAEIALGRGDFDLAMDFLDTARAAGLDDEVTRLLYGDAMVASGKPGEAAQAISDIGWAGERLAFQAWFRYWLKDDYPRAEYAWQAVLLLNPENSEAETWLKEAEARQGAQ